MPYLQRCPKPKAFRKVPPPSRYMASRSQPISSRRRIPQPASPTPHASYVSLFSDRSVRGGRSYSLSGYRRGRRLSFNKGSVSDPYSGCVFSPADSAGSLRYSSRFSRYKNDGVLAGPCLSDTRRARREPIVAAQPVSCAFNRPSAEPVAGGPSVLGDLGGGYGKRQDALCPQ